MSHILLINASSFTSISCRLPHHGAVLRHGDNIVFCLSDLSLSLGSNVTGYGLNDGGSIPIRGKNVYVFYHVQTYPEFHPASYPIGKIDSVSIIKANGLSRAVDKNRWSPTASGHTPLSLGI
jgi:hypothetical protein